MEHFAVVVEQLVVGAPHFHIVGKWRQRGVERHVATFVLCAVWHTDTGVEFARSEQRRRHLPRVGLEVLQQLCLELHVHAVVELFGSLDTELQVQLKQILIDVVASQLVGGSRVDAEFVLRGQVEQQARVQCLVQF